MRRERTYQTFLGLGAPKGHLERFRVQLVERHGDRERLAEGRLSQVHHGLGAARVVDERLHRQQGGFDVTESSRGGGRTWSAAG